MQLVIIGKSGQGKVVKDIAEALGFSVIAMLDDDQKKNPDGPISDFEKYINKNTQFIIAIGDSRIREKIANMLEDHGAQIATLIHPAAIISPSAAIAEGTVVMPNAVINADAHVGKHCIINTSAVVEHDCTVGDFSHISVNAAIGGTCNIGKHTWLGIGACVSNNINVCDGSFIGAGAVVVKDITEAGTYVSCPAKKIK